MAEEQLEGFCPAALGDFAVVLVGEHDWMLGEVVGVYKNQRVKRILHPRRGEIAVGPKKLVRVAERRKLDMMKATKLWMDVPDSFRQWEHARTYMEPAVKEQDQWS